MLANFRKKSIDFVNSGKEIPVIAGVAAGIYPLLHYCNSNFSYIETLKRLVEFIGIFILLPIFLCVLFLFLFKKSKRFKTYVLPVINFNCFLILLVISTHGTNYKLIIIAMACAILFALLLHRHYKKIIVFQFIMALLVVFQLVPDVINVLTKKNEWQLLPDNISNIKFKNSPNIYLIQPDGYANFKVLKEDLYNYDNSQFESFLKDLNFNLYENHRSNYYSTLFSNASVFMMKHHYYDHNKRIGGELLKARYIIVGNNPVHSILKNNNYKTHLIVDSPYFFANKPELRYDYSNVDISDIPYFSQGFDFKKNVFNDFNTVLNSKSKTSNNFFFIENLLPGHVATHKNTSMGKVEERIQYIEKLKDANVWLEDMVNLIVKEDPNGLIIIMADHGGFVGFDYTTQAKNKDSSDEQIESVFASALAIRWPNNIEPNFIDKLETNVNLFRILFSYLAENESYLNNLEEDKSFLIINENASSAVYEVIDENRNVVFKKVTN